MPPCNTQKGAKGFNFSKKKGRRYRPPVDVFTTEKNPYCELLQIVGQI